MEYTWPEGVPSNRQKMMEELVQGREMANQLQTCLSGDVRSKEGLVTKILGSFTNTLSLLNRSPEGREELISQIQTTSTTSIVTASGSACASAGADWASWDVLDNVLKFENKNEESYKSSTEKFQDRRGSFKRRKAPYSWTKDTLDLVDDGHAWRKYGQKRIQNTRHPRNYFRCTHKFDQGCKATKHVQRIPDKPKLFRTTYYGNHTCTDCSRDSELILDCSNSQDSSKNMIRFDNTNSDFTCKQEHPFFSSFTSVNYESVKKEEMIAPSSDHDHLLSHHDQSASRDYLMSPGLGVYKSSVYDLDDMFSRVVKFPDDEVDSLYEF